MSRILRRPMFRGGRVESKGDLKVIDQMGIAKLATGGRVGYDMGGEVDDYMEIIEAVRKTRPELPEKKGMSTADYLRIASAGMDILGAPSEGSGIGGALRTAAAPLSKLGGSLAGSLDARTTARAELLANEESAITDMAGAIMKSRNYRPDRGFALDAKLLKLRKAGEREQEIQSILADTDLMSKYILENAIKGETDEEKFDNASKILNNELDLVKNDLKLLKPKNDILIGLLKSGRGNQVYDTYIRAEQVAQGTKEKPKSTNDVDFNWMAVVDRINNANKDGGIIGYAEGGLTGMMAEETINTPEGSETMEEEVVEETPGPEASAPLTYDELRLRLPPEVSDSVVKLLAASDEALLEFSNIATQQDVDEFNVKYGVELVLPQV